MSVSRSWPIPSTKNLLHFVGDMHHGAINTTRAAIMLADLNGGQCPTPVARVFVGDMVDNGLSTEDTTAKAWLAGIADGAPFYTIVGNHDIYQNVRTVADWQAVWGYAAQNYVVDLPFCRLIMVNPDALPYPGNTNDSTSILLAQATLDWLDARLAETSLDCLVVCHAPLYNTCLGGATQFQSTDVRYFVQNATTDADSSAITDVLSSHTNAKAWISGHTHTALNAAGINTVLDLGHKVACLNCSSPFYTSRTASPQNRIMSFYVNYYPGDRLEARARNHGGHVYQGPSSGRVITLSLT